MRILVFFAGIAVLAGTPVLARFPIDQAQKDVVSSVATLWTQADRSSQRAMTSALRALLERIEGVPQPVVSSEVANLNNWVQAQRKVGVIETQFQNLRRFLNSLTAPVPTDKGWLELSETILQYQSELEGLHKIALEVYNEALQHRQTGENSCSAGQSAQTLLFNIYSSIQLSMLKSYAMTQAAYLLFTTHNRGFYRSNNVNLNTLYSKYVKEQAAAVYRVSEHAPDVIWRCDPNEFEDGKTYTGVKGLLQGYIVNEVDIDSQNSCRWECTNFQNATRTGCHNDKCPVQRQCTGRLFNCTFYDADMRVCMTSPALQQKTTRRYEYIQYKNGTTHGRINTLKPCETIKIESWWRKLPPSHCTYCFCQCEDNEATSERYISLAPATSDVSANKVVTGLRFVKQDRVLYPQIQQGLLLPNGAINISSIEWKPVDKKAPKFLMDYEHRKLDLDDIRLPAQRVLTGVRFEENEGRLGFNVMSAFVQFEPGTIGTSQNHWFSKPKVNRYPVKLKTTDVDLTAGQNKPTVPERVKDASGKPTPEIKSTFVEFGPSNYETDVGQTTIPLIELQPVVTDPPALLAGAGIFLKGSSYNAGFVAPRIFTYNYRQHIERS